MDVIFILGGVFVGDEDYMFVFFNEIGIMVFWWIVIKSGWFLVLGLWENMLVFGLSGNLVVVMVCILIFVCFVMCLMVG